MTFLVPSAAHALLANATLHALLANATLHAHADHADASVWQHTPELIVVTVGFAGFTAYLWRQRRDDLRRAASLPTTAIDGRQWLTVALLAAAGLGHLPMIPAHLREAPYMGVLFIVFTAAAFVLAVGVAFAATPAFYAASAAVCAAGVLAYVATRLVTFPQLADDVGNWREPLGVLCISVEAAVVVIAAMEWRRLNRATRSDTRVVVS